MVEIEKIRQERERIEKEYRNISNSHRQKIVELEGELDSIPMDLRNLRDKLWLLSGDVVAYGKKVETPEQARSNVEHDISRLEQNQRNLLEAIKSARQEAGAKNSEYTGKISCLNRASKFILSTPKVGKGIYVPIDEFPFYSLWANGSPILLYEGSSVLVPHTRRRDNPLIIKRISIDQIGGLENVMSSLFDLKPGSFCEEHGFTLSGDQEEIAADVFEKIFTGVKILPRPESEKGYIIINEKGEGKSLAPRHWGQMHLAQNSPSRIVQGELLGGGGSYKAYQFGEKVVVEFDQEARATYLFNREYFDNLRAWNRSDILSRQPEGFDGRVIHHDDRAAWKRKVNEFINKQDAHSK